MSISDYVAGRILEMLNASDGEAEIKRNELAEALGCVPSQINYAIASRFTAEQGFFVQSRRGGGGYIRITRVNAEKNQIVMHLVNAVGDSLDFTTARAIILNLEQRGPITENTAKIMLAAVSEVALYDCPPVLRDIVRASVFKNMLINLREEESLL